MIPYSTFVKLTSHKTFSAGIPCIGEGTGYSFSVKGKERESPELYGSEIDKGGNMLGSLLWTIVVILVVLWILGLIFHIAGGLVWILLVVALIVLIFNLLSGSRARRI